MDDFKRREFIKLSALSFAGIAMQLNSIATYAQSANAFNGKWNKNTVLNWDAFLERLSLLAKTQHEVPWDQKGYTQQVKQLLLQCNFPGFENIQKEFNSYEDKTPNMAEATNLHMEVDFQVSLFQFEKGEYISHHDHPDMTGVINVVSGNILTKNYTVKDELKASREVIKNGRKEIMQKCTIREVDNEIIEGGNVSILTSHEGNIHSLMPNTYTQMVDVFTPAYKQDTKTIWYNVNEDGFYGGEENVFEAEYVNEELTEIDTVRVNRRVLNQYVGSFRISDTNYLKVIKEGNQLILERTKSLDSPGMRMNLLPYEQNKFWVQGQDIRVRFNTESRQLATSLNLYFGERSIIANRIY